MNDTPNNQKKNPSSTDRLATCSMICSATGILCSFLYLPFSFMSGGNYPTGLICGAAGIVLALLSKNADTHAHKSFNARAITGIVLGCIAIGLTFLFFYILIYFYDVLKDPVLGPRLNEMMNQLQRQMEQQVQTPSASLSFLSFLL